MEEPTTLKDEIRMMREGMNKLTEKEEKKKKPFKIPWSKKINKAQSKKNYVTILYVKENGDCHFIKEIINQQTVMVEGIPRIATSDVVLRYKSNPLIIQPSWSVKPFSPADNYNDTERDKMNTKGYKLLLNIMKQEAIKKTPNFSWALIIIGLLVAAGVAYYFFWGK